MASCACGRHRAGCGARRREPRDVPILIGATGDQMMEMTGEIADGVVLNYCVPPEYNDRALELLERGARKASRTLETIDALSWWSVRSIHLTTRPSIQPHVVCQYLAQQPHIAQSLGVAEDVWSQISPFSAGCHQRANQQSQAPGARGLDRHITASGTPDEGAA